MGHPQSIYIRLEDTLEEGLGEMAKKSLENALARQYPKTRADVEVTRYQPYDKVEVTNIPLTMIQRAATDAQKRKATLSAHIVPISMVSQVAWRVEMHHGILLIATARADGTGDCIYTPLSPASESVDSLGTVLQQLRELHAEVGEVIKTSGEVTELSRFILSVMQFENAERPKH
jgi:hypothetical protein